MQQQTFGSTPSDPRNSGQLQHPGNKLFQFLKRGNGCLIGTIGTVVVIVGIMVVPTLLALAIAIVKWVLLVVLLAVIAVLIGIVVGVVAVVVGVMWKPARTVLRSLGSAAQQMLDQADGRQSQPPTIPVSPSIPVYQTPPSSPSIPVYQTPPSSPSIPVYQAPPSSPSIPVYQIPPSSPNFPIYQSQPGSPNAAHINPALTAPGHPAYSPQPVHTSNHCGNCGSLLASGAMFCPNCGASVQP